MNSCKNMVSRKLVMKNHVRFCLDAITADSSCPFSQNELS